MKTTTIAVFFLLGIYSSFAFELQNGVYKLGFAGPDCKSAVLAWFDFTPWSGSCSDSNTTSCVTQGQFSSYIRSCGPPPQQLLDFKKSTWVVQSTTATGTNCTNVQSATGNRVPTKAFRDSLTTGYMWSCSAEGRQYRTYDHCDPTSCEGSGGFVLSYRDKIGVCGSSGKIYFCEGLSYVQEPQSPVAAPVTPPIQAPVSTPVNSPVSSPVSTPVSTPVPSPVSTPESLPSPAAQSPSNNVVPLSTNTSDNVPTWAVTLLIIGAVVIVSLIVAMVTLYIRHKRNLYTRIHDEGELPVNRLPLLDNI